MSPGPVKRAIRDALNSSAIARLWAPMTRSVATVLMLHRFRDDERDVRGHDGALLRAHLEQLRKDKYNLSSLSDLIRRLDAGEPPLPRTVVFTVDDGYADVDRVAAPLFNAFDCPATVFLVTGFVDGDRWQWDDMIRFAISQVPSAHIELTIGESPMSLSWGHRREATVCSRGLIERLKSQSITTIERKTEELCRRIDVQLPITPPEKYKPMTWGAVKHWASRGID